MTGSELNNIPRSRSGSASSDKVKPERHSPSKSPRRADRPASAERVPEERRRSPSRSPVRGRHDRHDMEIIQITDDDASFILGSNGKTKRKLSRVCGAELNVKDQASGTVLEIKGSPAARERARLYVSFVMQQRVGPVTLTCDASERDDLTVIEVPHECVGYVTGKKGLGLRSIEEEWTTLMFFTELRSKEPGETEKLAIFGPSEWNRRGAKLKVMSAVEQKKPGYFTDGLGETVCENEAFDVDTMPIHEEDYSYALGKQGSTRKKLARASGAILEYVGKIAHIGGDKNQRSRARQYLEWLCSQRTSYVNVHTEGRDDCTVISVPTNCVAYVTGTKGSVLRGIEDETGTFIFLDGKNTKNTPEDQREPTEFERLLIFGHKEDDRKRGKKLIENRIDAKLHGRPTPYYANRGGRSRSRSYDRRGNAGWQRDFVPHGGRDFVPRRSYHRRSHSRSHSPRRYGRNDRGGGGGGRYDSGYHNNDRNDRNDRRSARPGDRPGHDRPGGDRPGGDRPGGDRGGDRPGGDRGGRDRGREPMRPYRAGGYGGGGAGGGYGGGGHGSARSSRSHTPPRRYGGNNNRSSPFRRSPAGGRRSSPPPRRY